MDVRGGVAMGGANGGRAARPPRRARINRDMEGLVQQVREMLGDRFTVGEIRRHLLVTGNAQRTINYFLDRT